MTLAPLAVLFASPFAAFATLAGAASIPIAIHLLNRRRFRVVEWAAMRFLLAARRQNVRRLRLEQLLLLAVRTLMIVLLIAAMCSITPWAEAVWQRLLPGGAAGAPVVTGRTHKVIIIDGSLSMTVAGEHGACFDRAKSLAAELVRSSSAGDGFSLVMMSAPAQVIIPGPAEDAGKVAQEIEALRCPHGNSDLGGALQLVEELVRKAPGKYAQREVYVLSDLQRSTWNSTSAAGGWREPWDRLQAQTQLVVLDVGRPDLENLAVTGLTIADPLAITGARTTLTATVHNFGPKARTGVKVELLAGSPAAVNNGGRHTPEVVQQESVTLPAGGAATVTFPYEFRAAGDFVFQARLEADALEADDVRSITVTVRDTVPVLVVNGKPAADRYEQAGTWLADALFPFADSARPAAYPARPKVIDTARFADAGTTDLSAYDCIFLCDVPRFSEREVGRLEAHLQRGGGLVFCLGPNVDLEAYNRLLFKDGQGMLPGKLIGLQQAPENGFFTPYADEEAYQRPPLNAFAGDDERASLLAARFKEFVRVETPPGSAARRVLGLTPTFADRPKESPSARSGSADPLILEMPRHRGRVVLVTSTMNTDWSSWPIAPSYPPFVQELFRFAMLQSPRRTLTVGAPIEELLPPSVLATEATVQTPDGRSETVPLRAEPDATRLQFAETDQSGLYRVSYGSPRREAVFAVNVPPSGPSGGESDLRRLNPNELIAMTPDEDVQVVTSLGAVRRAPKRAVADSDASATAMPAVAVARGPALARWMLLLMFGLLVAEMVLAWRFGSARAGSAAAIDRPADTAARRRIDGLLALLAAAPLAIIAAGGLLLIHAAWTDNALGFLPSDTRRSIETAFGVPPPSAGEGTRWRLEFLPYLSGEPRTDRWLAGTFGVGVILLAAWIYGRELRSPNRKRRGASLLVGLRAALFVLSLGLLLPQVRLLFEREGWPDLVVLIDDSKSMGHVDDYQDPTVKAKADELASAANMPAPQRLALVQSLMTRGNAAWLEALIARQAKLHIFHCSSRVQRLAEVNSPPEGTAAVKAVEELKATGPGSALGTAVRSVLQEFRGSALAGIVMFTDGVTTEGDDLVQAAQQAAKTGVPLYFIGVGDAHEPRDLILHDLQVEDTVHVQDRLVFEARLTGKGNLRARTIPVTLSGKQGDQVKELAHEDVVLEPDGKPAKVRLTHTPTSPGEREYIISAPAQPDETDTANNRLTRRIYVAEFQRTRVLYIEGYPRYEYRFLKTLLERESTATRANKTIDLKVMLCDADPDYPKEDRSAVDVFPATRDDLFNQYDMVILGDVDPRNAKLGEKHLQWLADFVREKGGGLLLMAGAQFMPAAYRDTPLVDVLPVELPAVVAADDRDRLDSYRLQLTPVGRMHPMFRFVPDEADNQAIWDRLTPLYWSAGVYKPKPAAEVLAVRPATGVTAAEPLVVQQFAGAGRAMFFGFDEAWRWRLREDEGRYNQFWIQTVRYLARARLGRVELRTDKQVPYREGEPIRITVRFPDDLPPPTATVQMTVEYVAPNGEIEAQTLKPAKVEGSRATYEAVLSRTAQGSYKFWLTAPSPPGAKPQAAAVVLPPPGEMDRLQMNRPDMERAALISRGRFYTLADAERLPAELPPLPRVTLNQPRPPWPLWNHPAVFALAIALVTGEWLLRKRQHLL